MLQNISLLALLVPSTLIDIRIKKVWLPWVIIFLAEAVVLILAGINTWKMSLLGMVPGAVLLIISLISKGAIGLGDGYLVCAIGSLTGLENTMLILTGAMIISAVVGIILMVFRHWGKKETMPFVPFLLLSFLLQICIG